MRKMTTWIMIFFWIFPSVFFQGCATARKDIPFVNKEISAITPLKVVRYKTPEDIAVGSTARALAGAIIGGVLLAGVGAGLGAVASVGKLDKEVPRPDFGKLVTEKYSERARKEIPNWPMVTIEELPIDKDYVDKSSNLLEIRVLFLGIDTGIPEFQSTTSIALRDFDRNVLWQKYFGYRGSKFDRKRKIGELKADDGKLLRRDLELKNYSSKTRSAYLACVRGFALYFHRSPDELGDQEIRQYLHHLLTDKKVSQSGL